MDHGRLIALGTIDELRQLVGDENVLSVRVNELPEGALEALRALPGVDSVTSAAKAEAEPEEGEESAEAADTSATIEVLSQGLERR